jgi:hypothetical protein
MKAITVRNIPKEVRQMIEERAQTKGLSLTRATIDLLLDRAQPATAGARRVVHHDLDDLAGSWTRSDAERFEHATRRKVDEDLWR